MPNGRPASLVRLLPAGHNASQPPGPAPHPQRRWAHARRVSAHLRLHPPCADCVARPALRCLLPARSRAAQPGPSPAHACRPRRRSRTLCPCPVSSAPPTCSSGGGDSVSQFAIDGIDLKVQTNPPPPKQYYQQNSQTPSAPGDPLGLTNTNASVFRGLPPGPISLQQKPGNISLVRQWWLSWLAGVESVEGCCPWCLSWQAQAPGRRRSLPPVFLPASPASLACFLPPLLPLQAVIQIRISRFWGFHTLNTVLPASFLACCTLACGWVPSWACLCATPHCLPAPPRRPAPNWHSLSPPPPPLQTMPAGRRPGLPLLCGLLPGAKRPGQPPQ